MNKPLMNEKNEFTINFSRYRNVDLKKNNFALQHRAV